MRNKKLLVVGASILQVPAIKKAKQMGLTVAVADYNPNSVGVALADKYYNCSTIDGEGMLAVAEKFRPNGIMTMATDMPMRTIAYVCEKTGLIGISQECALLCTDKIEMVKRFAAEGVPHPNYAEIESEKQLRDICVSMPCIMKPADSSGSRGVVLCHTKEECKENYPYAKGASRNGKVIIEEYMTGPEVSVEVFARSGRAHVLQITDKMTTGAPHFVELGHSQPSGLGPAICDEIRKVAALACSAVGLSDGPAHLEMIITESGPKMVEMGARMGGDCITSHLVPLSTGIDMTEQTIRYCLGLPLDLEKKTNKAGAILFFGGEEGVIYDIKGVDEAYRVPGIVDIGFLKNVGDTVGAIESSSDRIGYAVAQSDSASEAISVCKMAVGKIKPIIGGRI